MKAARMGWVLFVALVVAVTIFVPTAMRAGEKSYVRLIVPNAPGSGIDGQTRTMSNQLAKALGKPVAIENLPGAGGIRGIQEVVRAPKDGNTICVTGTNIVINPGLYKNLPYDPIKDVTQISIIGNVSFVLVINPTVPAKNLKELIALAKSQPGKLNYASSGNGTVLHLAAELFCSEAGVKITHVPYKGGSQLLTDLMGGHVDMAFYSISGCAQLIEAGKLRAIATSTLQRNPLLSSVPTLAEVGLPKYNYGAWFALIGPPNLPQPIVKRLNDAVLETLKSKEVRETFITQGTEIVGSTPQEARRLFEADVVMNAKLFKQAGVVPE
jgi:tripartite-type tricarboxylate transporter receptor subunit TctC